MGLVLSDPTVLATAPEGRLALEAKVGTDPLDALHHARRALIEQIAPLRALHGPYGLFDDRRKQLLEACKIRARMALSKDGAKCTEGMVEAAAYDDAEYERLLDEGYASRIDYIRLENEITEINEKIRSRELEIVAFSAEARLAR